MLLYIKQEPFSLNRKYTVFKDNAKIIRTIIQDQTIYGSEFSLSAPTTVNQNQEIYDTSLILDSAVLGSDEKITDDQLICVMKQRKTASVSYESELYDKNNNLLAKIIKEFLFSTPKFKVQLENRTAYIIIGDMWCNTFKINRGKVCKATFSKEPGDTNAGHFNYSLNVHSDESSEIDIDLYIMIVMAVNDATRF